MTVTIENLVGGSWSDRGDAAAVEDLNPADQRDVIGTIPMLGADQSRAAVDAAAEAFGTWRRTSMVERGVVLSRAAQLLRTRRTQIAQDITRENGKLLREAGVEVDKSADFLEYYAGVARLPWGELLDDARDGSYVQTRREPVGVVVAITPWNDPLLTPARKLAPALVTGNTVVLKPSTETPIAAQHFARALHDAGLPAGVLNTVTASVDVVGPQVLDDRRVAAVTVTGSTETGRRLEHQLAGRGVRFQAEMGGKNASVVMADADLDLAVATIIAAAFGQAGQRCTATSRVLVQRQVGREVRERLVDAVRALRVGPGSDEATTLGPLLSRRQQSSVLEHLDRARAEGAVVLCGGDAPTEGDLAHGCFVAPTIADVTPEMALWRDEVFGPVVAVTDVDDLEQALERVNESTYGLSAAIFTRDISSAYRFMEEADTGQLAVNLPTSGWDVHHPFGGFKHSGSAFKEQGLDGLRFYTRVKTAALRYRWATA